MARPRKTTEIAMEDYFAEMPMDAQALLLDRLQLIHRLTRKGLIVPGKEEPDVTGTDAPAAE